MSTISARRCPVCLDIFKSPKSLYCGHSFCAGCIDKLIKGNSICCPECRIATVIPPKGLPINFALQRMVKEYNAKKSEQSHYQCSQCQCKCVTEETWVQKENKTDTYAPYCSRCIIKMYSENTESVSAMLMDERRKFDHLNHLLEHVKKSQNHYLAETKNTVESIRNDIILAIEQLEKACLDHLAKKNTQLTRLDNNAKSLKTPTALAEIVSFQQSYKSLLRDILNFSDAQREAVKKTTKDLDSLARRFHHFLNGDIGDANGPGLESNNKSWKNTILVTGQSCFLVDCYWYRKMVQYLNGHGENPGPIDNCALMQNGNAECLKEHLEDVDYVLLPEHAWNLIKDEFGLASNQSPIARKVIDLGTDEATQKIVEVYPLKLQVALYSDQLKFVNMFFSRMTSLKEIVPELKLKMSMGLDAEVCLWWLNKDEGQLELYLDEAYDEKSVQDLGISNDQVLIADMEQNGCWPIDEE